MSEQLCSLTKWQILTVESGQCPINFLEPTQNLRPPPSSDYMSIIGRRVYFVCDKTRLRKKSKYFNINKIKDQFSFHIDLVTRLEGFMALKKM